MEVDTVADMDEAAAQARSILQRTHRIRENQSDDFQIQNQKTLLETQAVASNKLAFFLCWIGASAVVVLGLGSLGITWLAVKERTRDLGTIRALGATTADVFFEVLFESVVLVLAGGVAGLAVAWPASRLASSSASLPFVFSRGAAELAFAAATLLNLAFSLFPSRQAATVHPIEALGHE